MSDEVKFGLTIPQGWRKGDLPLDYEDNPVSQYVFSKSVAMAADNLNFDSIYAYDHLIPHYLDVISNGRAELGIGAGWYEQEYAAYGYDFPSNKTRITQLDESISIIKAMWTERYASFEGKYYKIKDVICNPKPIQKPYPLIMVGGSGEKHLLKVVAKHANRYNLFFGSPDEMKRKISLLKEYCSSFGRNYEEDIEYSVVLPCIIRESEDEIDDVLVQTKREDKNVEQYSQYLVDGIMIGTHEKILQGIRKYLDIGVRHFILHFIGLNNDAILRLFNSKVITKIMKYFQY